MGNLCPGVHLSTPDYIAANLSTERIIINLIVNHITRHIEEIQSQSNNKIIILSASLCKKWAATLIRRVMVRQAHP